MPLRSFGFLIGESLLTQMPPPSPAADCCSAVDSTRSSRPRAAAGGTAITAVMMTSYCLAEVAWISCGIARPRASTVIRSEVTLPLVIAQVTAS